MAATRIGAVEDEAVVVGAEGEAAIADVAALIDDVARGLAGDGDTVATAVEGGGVGIDPVGRGAGEWR